MLTTDQSEGLHGLQQWSEPLIFDRVLSTYRKLLENEGMARRLSRLHARVWRALIGDDIQEFEVLRAVLVETLDSSGLNLDDLAEVDQEIMTELLDVVVARYNRSHRTAMAYHLALMQLARRLGPARTGA